MKQFYIASNINLHVIFLFYSLFFLFFFLAWVVEITFRLALLIALLLKEERYTCVTFSELCPSPSLIMAMATPSSLAVVAQLWRAT